MTAPKSIESRREQGSDEYQSDVVEYYFDEPRIAGFLNSITGKAPVSAAPTSPVEAAAETPATI